MNSNALQIDTSPKQDLSLDIHGIDITKNGVSDFYWPVSFAERQRFSDDFITEYTQYINKSPNNKIFLPYKLLAKYLLSEGISIFWGDLLRIRFEKSNYNPVPPKSWRLWPYLFNKQTPLAPRFLQKFVSGPEANKTVTQKISIKRFKKIFKILQFKDGGLNIGEIKVKPILPAVLENDIVATERHATLSIHAENEEKDVVFCRSSKWYKPLTEDDINKNVDENDTVFLSDFLNILEKLYQSQNIKLENHSRKYFENIIQTAVPALRAHYSNLLSKPHKLPKTLWTGTGGNTWDMMLRVAVMHNGGQAVGHDHGAGLAHVDTPMMTFNEFWGCNSFYAFNTNQATELAKVASNWTGFDTQTPKIKGVKNINSKIKIEEFDKFKNSNTKTKKILMMSEIYDGDRARPGPSIANTVYVDWQARLLTKLKEWDYEVIMKLHPESPLRPPEIFEDMGATIVTERFEDVLNIGDVALFDFVYTTTFRSALSTNIPMVLMDFYQHPWTEKGRNLFEKRASLIDGYFDADNKEQLDWDQLKAGIENSKNICNNHEFFDYYYA